MATELTGEQYWSKYWAEEQPHPGGAYLGRLWNEMYDKAFSGAQPGQKCIEVGCANSYHLATIAKRYQLDAYGLDYSEYGCELSRERLAQAGVRGTIYHRDLFLTNGDLHGQFDYVVSFGLVEHFEDTSEPLRSMRRLLRPGGRILTTAPNVCPGSLTLFVRGIVGPKILTMHRLMSPDELRQAHETCGFETLSCGFEGMGLDLASDSPSLKNRTISSLAYRSVQAVRKSIELLRLTPPNTRLTGLYMLYVGRVPAMSEPAAPTISNQTLSR